MERLAAYGEPVDGTPFGRYRLIELLGRGGMGEVWRAHDTDTDRIVAIKVLPPHFSDNEEFQKRFRREAHAAAGLNSPHVVPIHNYGEIDGRLYVDMRLIEGRDLQAVLAEGPIEPKRAVRIIEGVALALHAAHQIGLVHRDVKPSNILLDSNDFAYLIDFGIARAIGESRMTQTGNTIGTFQYIAPERLGTGAVEDARVDIYSLACVLYECLAGDPPFDGDTMAGLVGKHLSNSPPRPSITQPGVPPAVDEVIATGMAKDPDQRYATTVELANAAHDAITTPLALPGEPTLLAAATRPASAPAARQQSAEPTQPATQQSPPDDGAGSPHHLLETQPAPETVPATPKPWWSRQRRQVKLGLIAATVVILAASASITGYLLRQPSTISQPSTTSTTTAPTTTTSTTAPPVAEAALEGLLLSPDQINTAMGATGMTVTATPTAMDDVTAKVADKACLPVHHSADAAVYAGSGWTAFRAQVLLDKPAGWPWLSQYVVSFSSAHDAGAFFTASAQQWPACANRQYTWTQAGEPDQVWTVGPVSNTNGTLSATKTLEGHPNFPRHYCQRALIVANNVVIDVQACTHTQSDYQPDSAVNIAHQIAAKVPT